MIDSFGRKINYLRISLTDRCNLRCKYCMPEKGVEKFLHEDLLSLEEIYNIIEIFIDLGIDKLRFTGGEPLVRKGIIDLIERVSKLNKVKDMTMTTNGVLLKKYARDLKAGGLNRVNISLDTLNPEKYRNITRGGNIKDVLEGIEEAKKVGLGPIKINTVLIGGFNDDEILDLINLTKKDNMDVRFIELMPIGEAASWAEENFIANNIILDKAKDLIPVEREDKSSPAVYYQLPGGKGKVGIINPISCKFCSNCNRVRLTSRGQLKTCLHSNKEVALKEFANDKEKLRDLIIKSIGEKEEAHHLEDREYIDRNMNQIGG